MANVSANIPAGLGYLAGGLTITAAEVLLIHYRHTLSRRLLDMCISATEYGTRWSQLLNPFNDERLQDEQFRERMLVSIWLPFAIVLAVIGPDVCLRSRRVRGNCQRQLPRHVAKSVAKRSDLAGHMRPPADQLVSMTWSYATTRTGPDIPGASLNLQVRMRATLDSGRRVWRRLR
jgi:hypothetical protein